MAKSKTKKPRKAPAKTAAKKPAAKAAPKSVSFAAIEKEANGRKIVLHIGCGQPNADKLHKSFKNDKEWFELRLDIDPSVKPHIVADMLDMSMIPDGSVNAIWSSHNVEHLYPHTVPAAMKEFHRVIKDEGHILVTLPDIQTVATFVANGDLEEPIYESPAGPICAIDIMYGLRSSMERGNLFMAHKTAFTAKSLGTHLREAGFTNIQVSRDFIDLWAVGFKYPPNHEKRNEKMIIHKRKEELKPPPAPPISRTPHPGAIAAGKMTDELDIKPAYWEETIDLGLKKKNA
ncbi:MAG: methyltransferase domain-containing protein [Rickettsiales bacterium]|nr:methyltransferase domain-containing protein [Rickettsiales bacterium]